MEFVTGLDLEEFNAFVENHPTKSHFLQSPFWGEVCKYRKLFPHYVGMKNNGRLVAAALLLEKKLPFGFSHFSSPRGFVLDYNDFATLKAFTSAVKNYVKKLKGIYFKIDPDIILHEIDKDARPVNDGRNNYQLVKVLKELGYRHRGYYRNFEGSQPRFTFRINTTDSWEEIEKRFSPSTKQRIRKAASYGIEVTVGTKEDLQTFYQLVAATEKRKNIYQHDYRFYVHLYDVFSKNDRVKLFLGTVYPDRIVTKLQNDLQNYRKEMAGLQEKAKISKGKKLQNRIEQLAKRLAKTEADLELFSKYSSKYPKGLTVSAQLIVYYGDKGWVLYVGNHDDLSETFANYLVYRQHIKHAHEKGIIKYDQFGTVGDLSKSNPLLGLHEFKKKFGGEYLEFIGEFVMITNRPAYILFSRIAPLYRKAVLVLRRMRHAF
ncbi:MAG: peptidoglycan bridge formation glycyltransferase FemA/FemB family protein [Bacillota bacterium]|jgi:peptidoglycan pentaglycine glycine transferase (the first glycine)|nr:peptidoglycan bridge formation glycyltransferase FemA/FemB family protein [Bacillota bacterium]